jgi:hypothetical protein
VSGAGGDVFRTAWALRGIVSYSEEELVSIDIGDALPVIDGPPGRRGRDALKVTPVRQRAGPVGACSTWSYMTRREGPGGSDDAQLSVATSTHGKRSSRVDFNVPLRKARRR